MPNDIQKVITLSRADSNVVPTIVEALESRLGFRTILAPIFGADGGGATLEKEELEVHLNWSREEVLVITTRNRGYEKTRDAMIDLIRSLESKND